MLGQVIGFYKDSYYAPSERTTYRGYTAKLSEYTEKKKLHADACLGAIRHLLVTDKGEVLAPLIREIVPDDLKIATERVHHLCPVEFKLDFKILKVIALDIVRKHQVLLTTEPIEVNSGEILSFEFNAPYYL